MDDKLERIDKMRRGECPDCGSTHTLMIEGQVIPRLWCGPCGVRVYVDPSVPRKLDKLRKRV